ncbi:acetyl-CoA synthetase-like protein [Obba rivulosa]|uniref:Acetyl-CoA synthetase-like protein n=1 Tax=Obba rivulosa TaxID=1052685 RepID=A0A8E2DRX0_9APHY|nr:acetyl-CoA synthetase-like protein [Obba rivulosa]
MAVFKGPQDLPFVPDDLTVPQFILDTHHPCKPVVVRGDIPCLIDDATGRQIGAEEIRARTYGLANGMHARWSIREDDVICIFSPNHVDYPVAMWAILRLGATVTGANPAYSAEELVYQLKLTGAKLLLVHPTCLPTALEAARIAKFSPVYMALIEPADVAVSLPTVPDLIEDGLSRPPSFNERHLHPGEAKTKVAYLILSSGTTGKPKAVRLSHYAVIANTVQSAVHMDISPNYASDENKRFRVGDVMLGLPPFYHIFGLITVLHFSVFVGMPLVVIPKYSFIEMLKSIERYQINHLLVVPPQIVLLCKHPAVKNYNLKSIRTVMSGAAPLASETIIALAQVLPHAAIGQGYGMTEATGISFARIDKHVDTSGSSGRLVPGVVARVVKSDGSLAGYGEPGHLIISSPSLASGYLDNEEATKETFVDGWLHTGDEVIINEEGEVFVIDRIKELIKVKGFQVAPAELEGHLLEHPDVADVCVVGVPDDYSGEVPLAFIVPSISAAKRIKSNPDESEKVKAAIVKHVADTKVHYKRLAGGIEFIDAIPKNPSGKLLRRFLRERAKTLRVKGKTPRPSTVKAAL